MYFFLDPPFTFPAGIKHHPFKASYEKLTVTKVRNGEAQRGVVRGGVYRDRAGRTRREERLDSYLGEANENNSTTITLYDPTINVVYFIDLELRSFVKADVDRDNEDSNDGEDDFPKEMISQGEEIGERLIQGFKCIGVRQQHPNGGVLEYWVSEDLQDIALATSVGSDIESTYKLFDVERVEPEGKLFVVPDGYVDEDDGFQ